MSRLKNMDASTDEVKSKSAATEPQVAGKATKVKKAVNKNRQSRHRGHRTGGPVCVRKGETVQRVTRQEAVKLVNAGWAYCPKSAWRKSVRGETRTVQATVEEKPRKKKAVKKKSAE
jgi:hypothetical protein